MHQALAPRRRGGAIGQRVGGSPAAWSRDLAIVVGATSAFAPAMAAGQLFAGYPISAMCIGAVTGAVLGAAMPALIDLVRGRVPLALVVAASLALGAVWGGLTGMLAGVPFGWDAAALGLAAGGAAGAVQLGGFWFPYTFQSVRGGRTWPVVVGALLVLPVSTAAAVAAAYALILALTTVL
jgi:hypothetical protein